MIVTMIFYEVMIHNFYIFAFLIDLWHLRATDLQVQSYLEPQKVKISYTMLFVFIWCGTLIVTMIVYEVMIHNFHIFAILPGFWHYLRATDLHLQAFLVPTKVKLSYTILFVSIWCMILVVTI